MQRPIPSGMPPMNSSIPSALPSPPSGAPIPAEPPTLSALDRLTPGDHPDPNATGAPPGPMQDDQIIAAAARQSPVIAAIARRLGIRV